MKMRPSLETREALEILRAGQAEADRVGLAATIAVVDHAGILLCLQRSDGAKAHTVELAIRKARSAAMLHISTAILERMAAEGRTMSPEISALGGGLPLMVPEGCAGAVGVSGGTSEVDHKVAEVAVASTSVFLR